ncbi:MAG: DUF3037 domain-containing protein [Planctomycetota bacterium]|nr:DUF3037 domain-containing protein [Planctomycetota bacterium]
MNTPARGFYSVVQYIPDGGRAEAANVGVVLYVPSSRSVEIRVTPNLARVRQFFRPDKQELRRIEIELESLKHRMELARGEFESEEALAQFAAARADAVRLTKPRLVMVQEAYGELAELYAELVGDLELGRVTYPAQAPSLPRKLAETFGRLEAQHKVWRPGRIKLPMVKRPFDVPIAYENGRVNYVRPESLDGGKLDDRMAKLGFHGQLIFNHPIEDKEGQLVVLSVASHADSSMEDRFDRALKEFNVRFIRFAETDDFAAEVERTAH